MPQLGWGHLRGKRDSAMFGRMTLISFMKVQSHVLSVNSPAQIQLEGAEPLQLLLP